MSGELEGMWKEDSGPYIKILSQYFKQRRFLGQDSNLLNSRLLCLGNLLGRKEFY